jgi:hypothetical protein
MRWNSNAVERGINPGPRDHSGTVSGPDFVLVKIDYRVNIGIGGQGGFERFYPEGGIGRHMVMILGHCCNSAPWRRV